MESYSISITPPFEAVNKGAPNANPPRAMVNESIELPGFNAPPAVKFTCPSIVPRPCTTWFEAMRNPSDTPEISRTVDALSLPFPPTTIREVTDSGAADPTLRVPALTTASPRIALAEELNERVPFPSLVTDDPAPTCTGDAKTNKELSLTKMRPFTISTGFFNVVLPAVANSASGRKINFPCPRTAPGLSRNVPESTSVSPLYVLAALETSRIPTPDLTSPPSPVMGPEIETVAVFVVSPPTSMIPASDFAVGTSRMAFGSWTTRSEPTAAPPLRTRAPDPTPPLSANVSLPSRTSVSPEYATVPISSTVPSPIFTKPFCPATVPVNVASDWDPTCIRLFVPVSFTDEANETFLTESSIFNVPPLISIGPVNPSA